MRAGIIGSGFMAEVHARAVRGAGGTVAGVASSSAERARAGAARLHASRAYSRVAELVRDPSIDVVHVCTPNDTHVPYALAALDAGKHVVCEKPLATSEGEAERLVVAAERAGVVATVPFVYRFHPLVREARSRVAGGAIGALTTISGSYLQDWLLLSSDQNWRVSAESGGASRAFADIGSHLVDLVEFVSGDRLAQLSAVTSTAFSRRGASEAPVTTEDIAAVLFRTASTVVGTLLVSQVAPGRKNALTVEIAGQIESIRFEQESPDRLWVGRRTANGEILRDPEQLGADAARLSILPAGHPMGYQDAFTAFVGDTYAAICGERPDGLPDFGDGARASRVTDAVLRSAASGEWVMV